MSHWQVLGLEPEADERGIKRAYARLLKVHRPDEDPDAFQRLREAYEGALAQARWRGQDDGEDVVAAPTVVNTPTPPSPQWEEAPALEQVEAAVAASPPEPSLAQMKAWLAEGKDREVMGALRLWLASDWLQPFERREQFEQDLLHWLESAPQWSHVFFDGVCQAMGWDEAQGNLPCERWRWNRLVQRCEAQVMEEKLRTELARFDSDGIHGQAAALLLKPLNDSDRRAMADGFSSLEWQRFTELAQHIEYQHPDLPERLGLQPLDNWRDWLPPSNYLGVYLFLWVALSALLVVSMVTGTSGSNDLGFMVLMPLLVLGLMGIGVKAYRFWAMVVVPAGPLDVFISRPLLPRRWYRQGAGLLLLRHIIPCAVPAALAFVWSDHALWLHCLSPVVVFLGTLYFTNLALSGGKRSIWGRALQALKRAALRLPWHLLQRERLVVVIAVLAMAGYVYMRMGHGW